MRSSRLAFVAAAVILLGGCQPTPAAAPPPASSGPAASSVVPSASRPAPVDVVPEPVKLAIITALTADTVSWIDGKRVPVSGSNVSIERLPGAAHQHSAPLSPTATFFLPQGPNGLELDAEGYGTVPCDRERMAQEVVGYSQVAPRLTFDAQGRVATMAAQYHP